MCSQLIIYYFSGTGNAEAVSNWIIEEFKNNKIPTEIFEIKKGVRPDTSVITDNTLIGFCYPTHGFNAPPIVLDFIASFPRTVKAKFFVLNTQAGMKMYKIFTPGLGGIALFFPAILLMLKGYKCVNIRPMDMPSNWISLHPGMRKKVTQSIINRCERITRRFAIKLINGKKDYRWIPEFPLDLVVAPIAIPYYFIGRFMIAKTFFASYKCNSCGLCAKQCPIQAIDMIDKRPYWSFTCESCMHCMNHCKQNAIETAHGFSFVLWWLAYSLLPVLLIEFLNQIGLIDLKLSGYFELIYSLIQIVIGLLVVFFGYRILHFLLRFKVFNYLVTFTSLTKLPFWRRYKFE